jgi:hypothetical protein
MKKLSKSTVTLSHVPLCFALRQIEVYSFSLQSLSAILFLSERLACSPVAFEVTDSSNGFVFMYNFSVMLGW